MAARKASSKKPTKKAVASKAKSVSRATSKKSTVVRQRTVRSAKMQSFKVAKADKPFFTFKPDLQTIYWGILAASVLILGLWVIDINDRVMRVYDQIDQTNTASSVVDEKIDELESQ